MVQTYFHCFKCGYFPYQFELVNQQFKLIEPCFSCVQIVLWSKSENAPKEIKEVSDHPIIAALRTRSQLLATSV
jgi:hypothetical protein